MRISLESQTTTMIRRQASLRDRTKSTKMIGRMNTAMYMARYRATATIMSMMEIRLNTPYAISLNKAARVIVLKNLQAKVKPMRMMMQKISMMALTLKGILGMPPIGYTALSQKILSMMRKNSLKMNS